MRLLKCRIIQFIKSLELLDLGCESHIILAQRTEKWLNDFIEVRSCKVGCNEGLNVKNVSGSNAVPNVKSSIGEHVLERTEVVNALPKCGVRTAYGHRHCYEIC